MILTQGELSFLGNLERLPPELLDHILKLSLFSRSLLDDNHSVLHNMKRFSRLKKFPRLQHQIFGFMRTEWFRTEIHKRYNLYYDYKSARQGCQSTSSSDISYAFLHRPLREQDLVSRTIVECPSCFQFLLDQRAILPSYYNCEGESFLYIALIHKRKSVARRLVRALTTDDLMSPMWLTAQRVGPSALDIGLSDDFMMTEGAPWSYNMERTRSTLDYHSFMFSALEKHPQKGRIERAYFENCNREPPGIL